MDRAYHKPKTNKFSSSKYKSSLCLKPKTPLEKQEVMKINTIITHLYNHTDAVDFREPVDYKSLELDDYPTVVKQPMDLGTVQKKLKQKSYKTVEQSLNDIQLVWDNCKVYNPSTSEIYSYADKLESIFRRMIKNYLPHIKLSTTPASISKIISEKPFTIVYKPDRSQQILPQKSHVQEQKYKNGDLGGCLEQELDNKSQLVKQRVSESSNQNKKSQIFQFKNLSLAEQRREFMEKLNNLTIENLEKVIEYIQEQCPKAFTELDDEYASLNIENMNQKSLCLTYTTLQLLLQKQA